MSVQTKNYTVYDEVDHKYSLVEKSALEVSIALGISRSNITRITNKDKLYQARYRITAIENELPPKKDRLYTEKEKEVMKQFNNAMDFLSKHYSKEFLSKIIISESLEGQAS